MNDRVPGARIEGQVLLRGADIYGRGVRSAEVRRRIGLVHRRLDLRPKSIRESLRSHLRRHGFRKHLDDRIEAALRGGVLWDEVKDRLGRWVRELSDGQQVRLGVARALAVEPEVLLLDDPCSGLDSASAARIEELIQELGPRYAVVLATREARQAARVASSTATFHLGRLARIEDTPTGRPV
jgi:phosphate transport system ATP-binding protein